MNNKTLLAYIGTAEDSLQDFMEGWKSGQPASLLTSWALKVWLVSCGHSPQALGAAGCSETAWRAKH
ncbi:MAG: hypothetical protein KJ914_00870 [Gammaproteobacteria bacterium]|nr:hypothetical protein [Gammaproteobacteria bacterium]MBU1723170.1 hypothetical protein [Gammaproteobacteria bacterium]MBU2005413.1 hypothetical protein [Gammaproteobacteria bacterium]